MILFAKIVFALLVAICFGIACGALLFVILWALGFNPKEGELDE